MLRTFEGDETVPMESVDHGDGSSFSSFASFACPKCRCLRPLPFPLHLPSRSDSACPDSSTCSGLACRFRKTMPSPLSDVSGPSSAPHRGRFDRLSTSSTLNRTLTRHWAQDRTLKQIEGFDRNDKQKQAKKKNVRKKGPVLNINLIQSADRNYDLTYYLS